MCEISARRASQPAALVLYVCALPLIATVKIMTLLLRQNQALSNQACVNYDACFNDFLHSKSHSQDLGLKIYLISSQPGISELARKFVC